MAVEPTKLPPAETAACLFGVDLWDTSAAILDSVFRPHARTAVKACHSSSKTFTAAVATALALYEGGDVVTTAPTELQVEKQLWKDVHRVLDGAKVPRRRWGAVNQKEIRLASGQLALGFATRPEDSGVRFQGFHARPDSFLLLIVDEAVGINPGIFEAIEGIAAGGDVRRLYLGNPTVSSGYFYDLFADASPGWERFTIDAFDTPNLRGYSLEALLALPERELLASPRPYLVSRQWVVEKYREWGESHPLWESRVRGRFPAQGEDALISLAWIEAAQAALRAAEARSWELGARRQAQGARFRELGEEDSSSQLLAPSSPSPSSQLLAPCSLGCDVARFGGDESVVVVRRGGRVLRLEAWSQFDLMATTGRIAALAREYGAEWINVDEIGMGGGVVDRLRELGLPVRGINVAEAPYLEADREKYVNLRAQLFDGLAARFRDGQIAIPADRLLAAQLAAIRYGFDSRGRLKIESKEDAKRRGAASPDRAEALLLAFAPEDPRERWLGMIGRTVKVDGGRESARAGERPKPPLPLGEGWGEGSGSRRQVSRLNGSPHPPPSPRGRGGYCPPPSDRGEWGFGLALSYPNSQLPSPNPPERSEP